MNRVKIMNQPSFVRFCRSIATFVLLGGIGFSDASFLPAAPQDEGKQPSAQSIVAKQAALVTEFEVNGLKVLVKRREGRLTVAAGLFIRGGASNITAANAGIETLMLSAATEASADFPREL